MGEANLSRYALIEEIGQGGMGTVYRATDTKLLREVAIRSSGLNWYRCPAALSASVVGLMRPRD